MKIQEGRKRFELSEDVFEKRVDRIFNLLSINVQKAENPRLIMVGGQAGAGKTGLVAQKHSELKEGAIIIDQDEIRGAFPEILYNQIIKEYDDREEYLILKPFVLKMRQALIDRAIAKGYNVVMETALQVVDTFIPQIQAFNEAGYKSELAVISVPEVDCHLSTLNRYSYYLSKDGICRRNTKSDPEMFLKLRSNLEQYGMMGIFDDIEVYIRGDNEDAPYKKIYSQKEMQQETPLQAFDRGQKMGLKATKKTFKERSLKIRDILSKFGEIEKLEQLSRINMHFENLDDREGTHE